MRQVGISIYPDYCSMDELKDYITRAKKSHMTRAFTSLQLGDFGFSGGLEATDPVFKQFFSLCNESGITVCGDVTNVIFEAYGATPDNLKPFLDLGLMMIRIDGGYTSEDIVTMTNNPYGIKIEMNGSFDQGKDSAVYPLLEGVKQRGNMENFVACFNYFPRVGTGHSKEYVKENIELLKEYGVTITAFVASQYSVHSMQPMGHGIPTLEHHRYLPAHLAAQELFALGVDTVLVGDIMAADVELERLGALITKDYLEIPVVYNEYVSDELIYKLENTVLTMRGDRSIECIRSMEVKGFQEEPLYCVPRSKYSVTIDNTLAKRYTGEIQIMMQDCDRDQTVNVIGAILEGHNLLEYVLYECFPYKLIPMQRK